MMGKARPYPAGGDWESGAPAWRHGKLRLREGGGDDKASAMRRLLPFAALFVTACATAPAPSPTPTPPGPTPAPVRTNLSGLNEAELTGRFGPAAFRVREGVGLKLQWQNATCVLDAYLYPPERGSGPASVLHVDARRPGSGETVAVESCVTALSR